jgi:hypothetical protein
MIISRPFGRKQEQERESQIPEVKPIAQAQPVGEPEKAEPETIELESRVSPETSEVDLEELEILPPDETHAGSYHDAPGQETPHAGAHVEPEPITAQEAGPQLEPEPSIAHQAVAPVEPEPTIAHEREILQGFFGETIRGTPLEKEIVREEVILSEESDLAAISEAVSRAEAKEQVTERKGQPDRRSSQRVDERVVERMSPSEHLAGHATAGEHDSEQVNERLSAAGQVSEQIYEQATAGERTSHEVVESDLPTQHEIARGKSTEPSGEEPFFRQMVRRNNVGIFGGNKEEIEEQAESSGLPEQVGPEAIGLEHVRPAQVSPAQATADVKSLEQIIEIPASMLLGDKEKEIVITLRLRLKADAENREAPADEFLLDGISR